jgi:hypothetical protein
MNTSLLTDSKFLLAIHLAQFFSAESHTEHHGKGAVSVGVWRGNMELGLPPAYRSGFVAVHGIVVILGRPSGLVLILECALLVS